MKQYNPLVPPQTPEDLLPYLNDEFLRVSQALNPSLNGEWEISYSIPLKYKPGTVKYFDGTSADPLGTGLEGLYRYGLDNAWHYLG